MSDTSEAKELNDEQVEHIAGGSYWGDDKAEISEEDCIACGICRDICPTGCIVIDSVAHIDRDSCVGCGACVGNCPLGAAHFLGD